MFDIEIDHCAHNYEFKVFNFISWYQLYFLRKHKLSLIKFKHVTAGLIRNMRNKNCAWKDIRYQGVIYNIIFRTFSLQQSLLFYFEMTENSDEYEKYQFA